jgi:hypothetical protein
MYVRKLHRFVWTSASVGSHCKGRKTFWSLFYKLVITYIIVKCLHIFLSLFMELYCEKVYWTEVYHPKYILDLQVPSGF